MKIDIIRIDAKTKTKIYEEHSILADEIENVLRDDKAIYKKTGRNQIIALGLFNRYVTVYFRYNAKTKQATITTAYPSSKKQIKHYRKKRKK